MGSSILLTVGTVLAQDLSGPHEVPLAERKRVNEALRRRMLGGQGWACYFRNHVLISRSERPGLRKGLVEQRQNTSSAMDKPIP